MFLREAGWLHRFLTKGKEGDVTEWNGRVGKERGKETRREEARKEQETYIKERREDKGKKGKAK